MRKPPLKRRINFKQRRHLEQTAPKMPTEIKAGAAPVKAIRLFALDKRTMELNSIVRNTDKPWLPGEIKHAVCGHAYLHGPMKPEVGCSCGIWSCKSRRMLSKAFPFHAPPRHMPQNFDPVYISAQIEQWGRVIEHEDGYRSEFARIIPETIQVWPRPRDVKRHAKLVSFLRRKYAGA